MTARVQTHDMCGDTGNGVTGRCYAFFGTSRIDGIARTKEKKKREEGKKGERR